MAMFDAVRIRSTPITEAGGYGGAEGVVFGVTTVSVTGVEVIGEPEDDCAVNVDFDGVMPAAWFQPSLVEVIGLPEISITIGQTDFHRAAGDWEIVRSRPWWAFWRR